MRTLFAREDDGKFYLSFFKEKNKPARVFDSKEELEAEVSRRSVKVEWVNG